MVINLEGRGLVVVVGCGHQTVKKLVKRIEETFDQPIYAMVGDFHFPVPKGRLSFFGVDAQRYLASGDGPLAPVGWREVDAFANWASANDVQLVLGGHDTSDDVLNALAARPDITFMPLRVGERRCLSC